MYKVKNLTTGKVYKCKTYSEATLLAIILHNKCGAKFKIY